MRFLNIKVSLLILVLFLLCTKPSFAAQKIFQDNFDTEQNNSFPSKWILERNLCFYNGQPAQWKVINGKLNIKLNGGGCAATEISPLDSEWNNLGDNYTVEFDMELVAGDVHNFAFRWSNTANWYDFFVDSPNTLVIERMDLPGEQNVYHGDFSVGKTIHFKLIVNEDHLQIYVGNPGELLVDRDMGGYFNTGKIALRATSGIDGFSETNFDNILVTSIEKNSDLNIPTLKQTDSLWASQIYNGANLWSANNSKISNWGCALVSNAMILQYYGINKLPDGTSLDPGSLNTWLKNNHGYDDGINNGYLLPTAISVLSKKAKTINNITAFDALETEIVSPDKNLLTSDLTNLHPDVLGVNNDNHFIVAKGVDGNTFSINDPYYNKTKLSDYSDTFSSLTRYIPSFTDLSYIVLSATPNVHLVLKDSDGNILASQIEQQPLIGAETDTPSGTNSHMIFYKKPQSGKYKIEILADLNQQYKLNEYIYDKDGNVKNISSEGTVGNTNSDSYLIDFNKNTIASSHTERVIGFEDLINDINENYKLKNIKQGLYQSTLALAINAQKDYKKKLKFVSKIKLDGILLLLKIEKNRKINDFAYNLLKEDISYIKSHLLH